MSVLVVLAHPVRKSFCGAVCDHVLAVLARRGLAHTLIDLYREGYTPLGTPPRHHVEALETCEQLVFVYPTWWSTQPALLSSWLFEAFEADLTRIEQVLCFVTHGGNRWSNMFSGQAGRLFIDTRVMPRCAPGARFSWIGCYGLDQSRSEDRDRYLEHAARATERRLAHRRKRGMAQFLVPKPHREGKP